LTHTSLGSVTIPVYLEGGANKITIQMEGILFVPIPKETVIFHVVLGEPVMEFGKVPAWVKNNAEWWAKGLISDDDFLKGIEYLVENGIISISGTMSESKPFNIGAVDLSQASPIFGSADAEVTIIEFGDYQCPNCKKWFLNTKPDIVTNYIDTGKANLYFVDFAFLGDDSITSAIATYCADEQGLYWDYHSHLYSNQSGIDGGWANYSSLKEYAKVLELDETSFVDCMDSGNYDEAIAFNLDVGISNGVKGTPSFVVVGLNGQELISGPQPYPVFQSTIDAMLGS